MKLAISAALAAALAVASGAALAADAALVIGNAEYDHGPVAKSAERDAQAVAEALREAGYEVTIGLDLNRVQMRAAMDEFAAAAEGADRIVIYYSGHAMRMQERTFLAPVDFEPVGEVAVAMDGVPLTALTALAATKPGASVFFLDAAQYDGFEPRDFAEPGIADVTAPEGVLIVSAAAPGHAMRRSRWFSSDFSRSVVNDFLAPGAVAMDVAAQGGAGVWGTGGVAADLTLVDAPAPEPEAPTGGTGDVAQQIELAFWNSVESSGTRADYEAYLERYPNGLFASIARNRIGAAAPASPSQPAAGAQTQAQADAPRPPTRAELAAADESRLGLSRSQRLKVQEDLTELGFDTNGVDGIFGRGTRGAIRQWQESEEFATTGFLDGEQLATLRDAAQDAREERIAAEEEAARLSASEAKEREERDWRRTRAVNTVPAYRRFIKAYPDSPYSNDARRIIGDAVREAEAATWEEARRRDTVESYASYLDQYPNGANAVEAQRRYDLLSEQGRSSAASAVLTQKEDAAWAAAQKEDTIRGYRDFIEAYPDSRHAADAQARLQKLQVADRRGREKSLGLDRNSWKAIEQRLAFLGIDPGPQDGKVTKATRAAIANYRRSRGLAVHAFVDKNFIEVLVNESNQPRQGGGVDILNQLFRALQ